MGKPKKKAAAAPRDAAPPVGGAFIVGKSVRVMHGEHAGRVGAVVEQEGARSYKVQLEGESEPRSFKAVSLESVPS